ncbi:MAG: penicillin-binding protein activator, partial [Gammaproteobacteria bacterium]|nr:penicillin-binding protein activator [Gammaproteobacteria bacterium]
ADAAGVYIGMASETSGQERDRLTLLAIEQWLFAGDGRRARGALSQMPAPASGELLWLWSADAAALSLWEGRPDRALDLLDPLSEQALPADHRARVEALRGDAWFQKGEPLRAVDLYTQRENWLDSPQAIEANRQRLWAGLIVSDTQTLKNASEVAYDPITRGWLSLAALANSTGQQGIGWGNGVIRWQETFINHPAIGVLSDLSLPQDSLLNYPRQVALLLPLSGNNETAGNAIKNGFLGSYFSAIDGSDSQQQIKVYDVNADGGVVGAYSQAVLDGAEFVVGPLLRRSVTELAEEMLLPVPVLSLNYLPSDILPPPGFFQFALAPEDEAASAAVRAIGDEGLRAVALVPANDWGRRVLSSFATEFEGLGGTLLEYRNYEPNAQDFSFEIENLMGLSQSVQRYQRLRANIGGPLQFDPRRRQDIDFVFLAADAKAGRLIKSQLKFHYAGELPVYSTSFIYTMDGRSDSDLNDVMFADAPWVVSPPAWIADYPSIYNEYWPAEKRLARLHAMGYDAYNLVGELFNAREGDMDEITGATGRLFLTADGRVHRRLAWARFERGQPVALPDQDEFQDMIEEFGTEATYEDPISPQEDTRIN